MARGKRFVDPRFPLHVVNRGNDRRVIFPQPDDYGSFMALLREGLERFRVVLYAYILMPTHFHLVLVAEDLMAISSYMHFVQRSHACDLRAIARTVGDGHIFQNEYWSAPIDSTGYLLNAIRYVEANALRAKLVSRAEEWEWGSLWERMTMSVDRDLLGQLPFYLPEGWDTIVNIPQEPIDLAALRHPVLRGRPAGPFDLRNPKAEVKNDGGSL